MTLTIVIVSYNVKYYLDQCLDSVFRAVGDIDCEVYVVDNHSHDGSVDYLSQRYPQIHIIDSNHNLGFSRANNVAIRQSQGKYVLLLNPDTIIGEHVLSDAVQFMEQHDEVGALGIRMQDANGFDAKESRRGLPTPMVAFYKMSGLCQLFPNHPRFGKYYMSGLPYDEPAAIEVISGAFCFLRRQALDKVGLLDETFFMYGEDIDLSCRILKGGYHNWYLPCRMLHYKGESSRHTGFRYVHVFYDAMLIFFRKHYGNQSLLLTIPIKMAIYGKAFLSLIKMQYERMVKSLGLFLPNVVAHADYVFIGKEEHVEPYLSVVRRKGLSSVDTCVGAEESWSAQQHQELVNRLDKQHAVYLVFDTSAFSYEYLLRLFSDHAERQVQLATYHPDTKMIITAEEIFK